MPEIFWWLRKSNSQDIGRVWSENFNKVDRIVDATIAVAPAKLEAVWTKLENVSHGPIAKDEAVLVHLPNACAVFCGESITHVTTFTTCTNVAHIWVTKVESDVIAIKDQLEKLKVKKVKFHKSDNYLNEVKRLINANLADAYIEWHGVKVTEENTWSVWVR